MNSRINTKSFETDFFIRNQKHIFFSIILLNISLVFLTKFYPSMDGPAHLYNSNLIANLIAGNETLNIFFEFNQVPVPNWISHFFLSIFNLFLPAWIAEKLLLTTYISGMSISFRTLIETLNNKNIVLSVLIFPFIFSFLFHLGFYNYSISFIFLFTTLNLWFRDYQSLSKTKYTILALLLLVCFFSNILTYAFLGITLGVSILMKESSSKLHTFLNQAGKRLFKLFFASLPSLLLAIVFFVKIPFPSSTQHYYLSELFKWINDVRCLIVYSYNGEEIFSEQIFHIILAIIIVSIVSKKKEKKTNFMSKSLLIVTILALILFFIIPNGFGAGMMSDRFCLMFYILFVLFVITKYSLPSKSLKFFSIAIIVIHLILVGKHIPTLRNMDKHATTIHETAKHIEENKIVLPINLSDNWLEPHFSNYLGADKPLIILENYELSVHWFPLKWNKNRPSCLLDGKESLSNKHWHPNTKTNEVKEIDYLFIYGNIKKLDQEEWSDLNEILDNKFKLKYKSENNYAYLYERNFQNK